MVVENPHTLLLPERRGNNRVDSLHNLLDRFRVALLFLIPGVGETLREWPGGDLGGTGVVAALCGQRPATTLRAR